MAWKILKTVLRAVTVELTYKEGDLIRLILVWHGKVVFDRTLDVMPHV